MKIESLITGVTAVGPLPEQTVICLGILDIFGQLRPPFAHRGFTL